MTIRIDPGIPLVWRTPHLLQFGADEPICTLPATPATERILAALIAGVPSGALEVIAEHAGAALGLLATVMQAVGPALLPEEADAARVDRPAHTPLILLDGPATDGLRTLLSALGMRTTTAHAGGRQPDAVLLTASFVVSPARHAVWLSRDIPHLPIVFGDRYVEAGPLIEPGAGPCLRCISLHRRDADPAWPVISMQLDGTTAATLRPLPTAIAVVQAARMLDDLLNHSDHSWAGRSIRIEPASMASARESTSRTRSAGAELCQET